MSLTSLARNDLHQCLAPAVKLRVHVEHAVAAVLIVITASCELQKR